MYRGYIKLWRRLKDSEFWISEKFSRAQAFVDLIMLANHRDSYFRANGTRIDVKRGQLAYSELTLAERWKWSRGKVRRFLSELENENEQKIVQAKSHITSLITIINYEIYQGDGTTHSTTDSTTDGTHLKNDKNVKNEKNKDTVARRRQIPPDFILSEKLIQFAKEHGINGNRIHDVFEHFKEHHQSRGTTMLDWDKAFMTWVRNDKKFCSKNNFEKKRPPADLLKWGSSDSTG